MSSARRIGEALRDLLAATSVEHRPNHTGATKLSYVVDRGGERLWVRVAADDDEHAALLRWGEHAARLSELYAAPPVLDRFVVEGRAALVFPFLPGPVATRADLAPRAGQLLAVLGGLHADTELAAALGPPVTAGQAFTDLWVARFVADLAITEGYVDRDEHLWLTEEVEALTALIAGPAFDEPVHSAVHGDPWHENLLLGEDRFWLLDWEDLAVGDPVVDEAIVHLDAYGHDTEWPDTERHRVARRALFLDAVIDVAADWVETADPVVRDVKDRAWRTGLEAYRAAYP
jgi:aminoglycoside phosphotransferase (APT) family kinase protein